ncbi:MAG: endo-alpha-N-acetylgalactosaminidase family protein [Fimbriimonadales bacterium]
MRSSSFEVQLFDDPPGIAQYRSLPDGPRLLGGSALTVLLHDRSRGVYTDSDLSVLSEECPEPATEDRQAISFIVTVCPNDPTAQRPNDLTTQRPNDPTTQRPNDLTTQRPNAPQATFRLRFSLEADTVSISSEIVSEASPFEIASVFLPLFQVGADEPGAALVLPTRSGRLVGVAGAKPERAVHKVDWFEPAPVAMALHDLMLGVLTLDTVDCQFLHEVHEDPRAGSITVELLHRHRTEKPELSFLAQKIASCKVRLVAAREGEKVDWTEGAALVRDTIQPNLSELYAGALIYKVVLQVAGSKEAMTYGDVLELIRRVSRLTGGARQIMYLVGWQHGGHDTGYPDVFTANPRVGTFAEFRALKEAAKAENAIVSLHDNYHDAYMDSPAWDPAIVCVERTGELRKGGIWGGGQAYEIGPAKYAPRCAPRVEWTVKTLDLEQTTHLDVLSDKPDMVDFDPAGPASREQNALAKRAIVETFRKIGVDVTSEVLTSPFVPFMHHFWHVERRPVDGWGPEERIPLIPFIYHGKVTAGGDASTDAGKLDQIEYGWTFSADWSNATPDSEVTDLYYLVWVPSSLLAQREIAGFERNGDWETVIYAPDTYVRVNRKASRYEVMVDGALVAKDFATFAKVAEDTWVAYSREGGTVRIPVSTKMAEITPLVPSAQPVLRWDGGIALEALARVPYRIKATS